MGLAMAVAPVRVNFEKTSLHMGVGCLFMLTCAKHFAMMPTDLQMWTVCCNRSYFLELKGMAFRYFIDILLLLKLSFFNSKNIARVING